MLKFIKNKFLFIILISVVTLVLLIVGAIMLYKDNSLSFNGEGYIISTTTKKNAKYYFSANTKYKKNVDNDVTFKDNNSKSVVVDPASFVHYLDGSIGYLKRGALVNLNDITSSMITYYNVNDDNLIKYDDGGYTLTSNKEDINVNAFVGRISDKKYIIAGKNLSLQIPNKNDKITGDYFEILFIENGIIKIDNQEASYQVTAQDSYVYIGDNIVINLGNEKIYYDGDAKMLLSQITINGDENINLDNASNDNLNGGGAGDGDGTDNGTDGTDNSTGDGNGTNGDGFGVGGDIDANTDGTGNNTLDGAGNGNGVSSGSSNIAQIELIKADVTSTTIDASFQLNNASAIKGTLVAYLTNIANGNKEYAKNVAAVNGTFTIKKESLAPETEYTLTIVETGSSKEKQYFQKTFKTNSLGLTLEKEFATDDSLAYNILFDENTEVTKVKLSIYDNNGSNSTISPNEYVVSVNDISSQVKFTGLQSNSSYSVSVDTVWINNAAYSNVYTINRIDTTLKKTPELSGISVDTNSEEVKFTIKLDKIKDPDKGILSYTYYIYLADDINLDNDNPSPVYFITKNDADELTLNLNEISELKAGLDYRCRIVAQYNDNEMVRETSTDYSGNFLVNSKPNVSFVQEGATMNKVTGTLTLVDANCTVPVNGRACLNKTNNFILRYYKLGEDETSENDVSIAFDNKNLSTKINITDLSSDTTYVVKVYGDYYDDKDVVHKNVQIGDSFYIKTDESEDIKLKIIGDNKSGYDKDGKPNSANVVTFDSVLIPPQNSTISEEISTMTLKLYSGNYNKEDNLIGTYVMNDKDKIKDFFSSYTITNSLFTNDKLGKLDSLSKMISATNNSTGTLNGSYTVEITKVMDSTGRNEIKVEDNIYTFKLTPEYYLDSRIDTNPNYKYITVTPIAVKNLTDDEYTLLSKSVSNLDDLNDDTIVGLTIENSLSDAFVDSAFNYQKVIVDYVIYNSTTKKEIKRVSVDMGNKYQPKTQTIYLDSSELDDGKKHFTRGYDYKVSYELNFRTEDGSNPIYTNSKLEYNLSIVRQMPIYSQYISNSTSDSIIYRYNIKDVDNALFDKKLYYTIGDDDTMEVVNDDLVVDNNYHDAKVPINDRGEYAIYLNRKDTKGKNSYTKISDYQFESEYSYNNEQLYSLVNDNDNTLKIKLNNNDITNRAVAYKVVIKAVDDDSLSDYVRFFLASKLNVEKVDTGQIGEDGQPIINDYKYIAIDYANISKYMGHDLTVSIYDYYDSGLVGINQKFENGLILENKVKGKYLNIYNAGVDVVTTNKEENEIKGIYMQKIPYSLDSDKMYLYNYLLNTNNYNPMLGTSFYSSEVSNNVGINYGLSFTNNGVVYNDGKNDYFGYNAKMLKVANLKSSSNSYRFDSITPKVSLDTSGSTINSISLKVNSTGVYGQFIKDGQAHNKFYFEIYSDSNLENKLKTLSSDITINGDTAEAEAIFYENLVPDTTYYVAIYAYLNGKYTRLYDMASKNDYVVKTYEAKTLDANGILDKITYSVVPVAYNNDSSDKRLTWRLKFKNTDNYKIRFELYDNEGNPVNFDGTKATSCDNSVNGTNNNGYVNGCYIQINKEKIKDINNVDNIYTFVGDKFVFGGGYYKLVVYAVPYTNGVYLENDKLILYQNDSLSTTGDMTISGAPNYNITIPTLEEATFNLNNTLESGYKESDGYYIKFVPTINDKYFVIKYGNYTVTLKDEKGSVIENKSINVDTIGENLVIFKNLSANTLYYIELSYETYRNNNGYTESQKVTTTPFTDFIYTPIDAGITLGTITAQQNGNQKIILTYNGASNITNNIVRVKYTVSLKGGSSKASGEYSLDNSGNIFTVSADKTPKLILDLSASNDTSFSLRSGNTYIISTQYWYIDEKSGQEVQLTDKATGNQTFTTILNL